MFLLMGVDMKKLICITLAAMALTLAGPAPSHAFHGGHGGHVGVWVGPGWWGPGWWGSYYPYDPYYPYYAAPPAVIQEQPDTYIQQQPPQAEEPSYWYFCKDPKGYYPYVKNCPKGWLKVVPSPTPGAEEE